MFRACGLEGIEKKMETVIMGYVGTTICMFKWLFAEAARLLHSL